MKWTLEWSFSFSLSSSRIRGSCAWPSKGGISSSVCITSSAQRTRAWRQRPVWRQRLKKSSVDSGEPRFGDLRQTKGKQTRHHGGGVDGRFKLCHQLRRPGGVLGNLHVVRLQSLSMQSLDLLCDLHSKSDIFQKQNRKKLLYMRPGDGATPHVDISRGRNEKTSSN